MQVVMWCVSLYLMLVSRLAMEWGPAIIVCLAVLFLVFLMGCTMCIIGMAGMIGVWRIPASWYCLGACLLLRLSRLSHIVPIRTIKPSLHMLLVQKAISAYQRAITSFIRI